MISIGYNKKEKRYDMICGKIRLLLHILLFVVVAAAALLYLVLRLLLSKKSAVVSLSVCACVLSNQSEKRNKVRGSTA